LAAFPIGAYEPRWFMRTMHCDPAEAVEMHGLVGARVSVGLHSGTFCVSDEGREAPALAVVRAVAEIVGDTPDLRTLRCGETVAVGR